MWTTDRTYMEVLWSNFPSGNPASLSVDCCTLMSHVDPFLNHG